MWKRDLDRLKELRQAVRAHVKALEAQADALAKTPGADTVAGALGRQLAQDLVAGAVEVPAGLLQDRSSLVQQMLLVWAPLASPTRALALLVGDPKLRPEGTKGPGAAAAEWAGLGSVLSGAALAHSLGVLFALRTLRNLPPSAILVLIPQLV